MENILLNLNYYNQNIDRKTYNKPKVNKTKNQYTPQGYADSSNVYNRALKMLTLMITEQCDLRCTYCFELHKNPRKMTFDECKQSIDIALGLIDDDKYAKFKLEKDFCLNIMGGEPLLEDELAYKTIKYFDDQLKKNHIELNWYIWIPSNGSRYFTDWSQKIVKEYKEKLLLVLSLDGCEECHNTCRLTKDGRGSYATTRKAFDHYRYNSKKYNEKYIPTKFTISPQNLKYYTKSNIDWINEKVYNLFSNWEQEDYYTPEMANEYYKAAKEVGDYIIQHDLEDEVSYIVSTRSTDTGRNQWENDTMCEGAGRSLCIFPGGDIYGCNRLAPIAMKEEESSDVEDKLYKFGNIWDGIDVNGKYSKHIHELENINRCQVSPYKCYNCPASSYCHDCIGDALNRKGSIFERNSIDSCNMNIADALARVYIVNSIYRKREEKDPSYFFKTYRCNIPRSMAVPIIGENEYNKLKFLAKEEL